MFNIMYDGTRCTDIGVLCVRRPNVPAPVLIQEEYVVPGRDGVLLSSVKRYEPIEIPVEFNFMSGTPDLWGHSFRRLKRWLKGSGRLKLSDDQDVFYNCYRADVTSTERSSYRIGAVDVVFHCDPYTYLLEGDYYRSPEECVYNAYEPALPIYHVTASAEFDLTVNGNTFHGKKSCYIDVEKQETTRNGSLINTSVSGDYLGLTLQEGENTIEIDGGTLEIMPRWRTL